MAHLYRILNNFLNIEYMTKKQQRNPFAFSGVASLIKLLGSAYSKVKGAGSNLKTAPKYKGKKKSSALIKTVPKKDKQPLIYRGMGTVSSWVPRPGKLYASSWIMKNISRQNMYNINGSFALACNDGRQDAISMVINGQGALQQLIQTVGGTAANATKRMLLRQVFTEFTFTNSTNAVAYVQVYDLFCKRELSNDDAALLAIPETLWDTGEKQQGNTLGKTLVGSYPSRVPYFNEYYAIAKKQTHLLQPGEVHKHKVVMRPNRIISQNRINESCRYAKLSANVMIVLQGTPVDNDGSTLVERDASGNTVVPYDISGNQTENLQGGSIVTTSPCKLNIVYTQRYVWQWSQDADSDIIVNNNLTTGNGALDVMEHTGIPYDVSFT